jgi:hypothetical protein
MAGERNRVDVDGEAMAAYRKAAGELAGQLRSVGTTTLSGVNSLPHDAFGTIGAEIGLSGAFQTAAQAQLDGVSATASGIAALADSVGQALAGYQVQDDDAAANVRQASQPS